MAQQRLGFLKPFLSRAKEMAKLEAPAVPAEDLGSVLNIHMGGGVVYKHLQLKFQEML